MGSRMTAQLDSFYEREGENIPDVDSMSPIQRDGEVRRTLTLLRMARLRPGERVLDVGCGSGYLLGEVSRHTADLSGVDIAESRIGKAKSRLAALGATADLRQGTAETLPFDDASFDVVFCSEVLEHLPEPGAGLAEIRRVLKPGGRTILSVPYREKVVWVQCMHCGALTSATSGHLHSFDRAKFLDLVTSAGFTAEECRGTYPRVNRKKGLVGKALRALPNGAWLALDSYAGGKLDKGNWLAVSARRT